MRADIHPRYDLTTITCAGCGAQHQVPLHPQRLSVDVCGECHPFFTGVERQVDRGGRVARFEARRARACPRSSYRARNNPAVMTTYIALLRGINVGGNRKIHMADLREMFAAAAVRERRVLHPERQPRVHALLHGERPARRRAAGAPSRWEPVSRCR